MFVGIALSLFFSNVRQKGDRSKGERRWEGTEKSRGRGNYNQDILCEKESSFNKRKNNFSNLFKNEVKIKVLGLRGFT